MTRRFPGLLAASMFTAVMLLATACGSNGGSPNSTSTTSSATPGTTLTVQQIIPLFMQCLADHNIPIWDKAQGDMNVVSLGKTEGWYVNGRVVANNALHTYFEDLEGTYPISPDFQPEQTIGTWVDNAAATRAWPTVCGSLPAG